MTGRRPTNEWGGGDLPAPYAEGDIIDVPPDAPALERMRGLPPGRYRIVYATSIGEGDEWYFRVGRWMTKGDSSDRLHVIPPDVDWLAGCTLIRTADPAGLAERQRLLAGGWSYTPRERCPTCGRQ